MDLSGARNLPALWRHVHTLNRDHFPDNRLMPIGGGGRTRRPEVMFVFINPTHRNASSSPDWSGPRYPFIGTREVWRVFHRAGLLPDTWMERIEGLESWTPRFAEELEGFLKSRGLYLTNLVKWTGSDASLPGRNKIGLFLPVMRREIELVQPRRIVAFGLIPLKHLTGRSIRLEDYHSQALKDRSLRTFPLEGVAHSAGVVPCYFPVGRGNPSRAVELLNLL